MSPARVHGFLTLCKPRGWTSHDVVARVRRILGTRHLGHAGTLDPLAEGVLPLAVGRATRLVDRLVEGDKAYFAELTLGQMTDTLDADGAILERRPVPRLMPAQVEPILAGFRGPLQQVPPAYSAISVGGRRAYALARAGATPSLPARAVTIHSLELAWLHGERLAVRVRCSKGTYVRALARDMGEALGCGAHVSRLVRTAVGGLTLATAAHPDELADAVGAGRLGELLLSIDETFLALAALQVGERAAAAMCHGATWRSAAMEAGREARVYTGDGEFLGLATSGGGAEWRPRLALEAA